MQRLAQEWPGGPDDLGARVADLHAWRLLFEEDGQVLSLVPAATVRQPA